MLSNLIGPIADGRLTWLEPVGIGFFDCDEFRRQQDWPDVYDADYFAKYQEMARTPIGQRLNAFRVALVARYALQLQRPDVTVLDVGIGDGAFLRGIESFEPVKMIPAGMDVNPVGIAYLKERDQLVPDPWPRCADIVTFWDSLEHIRDPREHLKMTRAYAIVSLPVFADALDAQGSKHFRPEEHFWYFTRMGFAQFAQQEGFEVVDVLATESAIGRESIETFVLKRRRV